MTLIFNCTIVEQLLERLDHFSKQQLSSRMVIKRFEISLIKVQF